MTDDITVANLEGVVAILHELEIVQDVAYVDGPGCLRYQVMQVS